MQIELLDWLKGLANFPWQPEVKTDFSKEERQ
jgi:hypothetical protein